MADEQYVGTLHSQDAKKKVLKDVELHTEFPFKKKEGTTRRNFLMSWAGISWLTFTAASGAGTVAMGRFMLPNVLFEPPQVFKAGTLEDFEYDKPDERFKQSHQTWVVKLRKDWDNGQHFFALSTVCTHLGCTPNVLFNELKIKCPCHGSGFYFNGINFEGPAPRPLERWKVFVDPVDGQIVIDKTKKYQKEKEQWTNPDSYIDLSSG